MVYYDGPNDKNWAHYSVKTKDRVLWCQFPYVPEDTPETHLQEAREVLRDKLALSGLEAIEWPSGYRITDFPAQRLHFYGLEE